MGRPLRITAGNFVYHVVNRANGRDHIFDSASDYAAFERILMQGTTRRGTRLLAYCVMPNHWHLVVWPRDDGELSGYVGWIVLTHTQRFHANRGTAGAGHVYQGRFRSFVVAEDQHFLRVCRYVEANPARAGLVERAEDWRWSSLWRRLHHGEVDSGFLSSSWPVPRPRHWVDLVNETPPESENRRLRDCSRRGRPYADAGWVRRLVDAGRLPSRWLPMDGPSPGLPKRREG